MNKRYVSKKILWLVEYKDLELDYINSVSSNLDANIKVVSIKYWLFLPNIQKFDLIIIPFLPSAPSPNASLIKSALESGINVIVMNWWQSFSSSEIKYRSNSLEYFSNLPLHFVSYRHSYTNYLLNTGFKNNIIENELHYSNFFKIQENYLANDNKEINASFLIDFDYGFANTDFEAYRSKTGYVKTSLQNRINFSKDFLDVFVKDVIDFARINPLVNIKVGRYPNTSLKEIYQYFRPHLRPNDLNISFNFDLDIQKFILDCNILITNNIDMAINKNINGGYSAIYKPLKVPEELKDINEHNLNIIKHLKFKVDDIVYESSKKTSFIEKENNKKDSLTFAINKLISLEKSYNIGTRFILISLDRLKIFRYNFKELLKLLIKLKFSKNSASNYFIPFTLSNQKAKMQKR